MYAKRQIAFIDNNYILTMIYNDTIVYYKIHFSVPVTKSKTEPPHLIPQ